MKNLFCFFAFYLLILLSSCTKESMNPQVIQAVSSNNISVNRSTGTFYHNIMSPSGKYGYQMNIYENGILIESRAWKWVTPDGSSESPEFTGDNEKDYTVVVQYKRKTPSIPVTLSINWASTCSGVSSTETFVVGSTGTTKTHTFLACE